MHPPSVGRMQDGGRIALASEPAPVAAPRRAYKIAGPQTWSLAREFYLSGMPAPEVARRLDVSEHNLRRKAWKEGWTRRRHCERVNDLRLPPVGGDRRPGEGAVEEAAPSPDPPQEADALAAAKVLVRRGAASALGGAGARAAEELRLASELVRAQRLVEEAETDVRLAAKRAVLFAGWSHPAPVVGPVVRRSP